MKKTKKEMFNSLLEINEVASNAEMVEFINHELELLNKKKSSGATAKQTANVSVKNEIVEILQTGGPKTITEIAGELNGAYSNQKISALTTQLVKEGIVNRSVVKKVAYFTIL